MTETARDGARRGTGAAPDAGRDPLRLEAVAILPMTVAGAIWGAAYVVAGVPEVAVWPWSYTVLTVAAIVLYNRGWTWTLHVQLLLSLFVPWALMLHLGGFQASGAVTIWSTVAPIAAVLISVRLALYWSAAYVVLLLLAAFAEPDVPPGGRDVARVDLGVLLPQHHRRDPHGLRRDRRLLAARRPRGGR